MTRLNPAAPAGLHAVDPGVEYYALAVFDCGALIHVGVYDIRIRVVRHGDAAPQLVIEKPQIVKQRGTRQGAARAGDVADLLWSAGRVADRYENVVTYTPTQWKGNLGKTECHARTWGLLTTAERSVIDVVRTKNERGHIMDAVGLGLVHLWRRGR